MKTTEMIEINGVFYPHEREMTAKEIAEMQAEQEEAKKQYIQSLSYDELVNQKIRERYSESQELAILRQKDEKPAEYEEYYQYCEECKKAAKEESETE